LELLRILVRVLDRWFLFAGTPWVAHPIEFESFSDVKLLVKATTFYNGFKTINGSVLVYALLAML
jgi:hypothetical protein